MLEEKKLAASGYALKSPLIVRLAVQFSQIQNRGEQQTYISSWSQKITVVSLEKFIKWSFITCCWLFFLQINRTTNGLISSCVGIWCVLYLFVVAILKDLFVSIVLLSWLKVRRARSFVCKQSWRQSVNISRNGGLLCAVANLSVATVAPHLGHNNYS